MTDNRAPADRPNERTYGHLWHLFERSRVVPFLGAGASADVLASNESGNNLPTGRQLANSLASILGLAEDELDEDDLIEVASCFQLCMNRVHLEGKLKNIFSYLGKAGPLHQFIAERTPPFPMIVTTNYDTLIEEAFRSADRPFHLLMTPLDVYQKRALMWWGPGDSIARIERAERIAIQPFDIPIIYKMHGGLAPNGDWIKSVVTEDDYFEIGGRIYQSSLMPMQIASILHSSSLLFLGYSLRDIHVRFLIGQLAHRSNHSHFLVSKKISRLDTIRFNRLGITGIELPLADFLTQLIASKVGQQTHIDEGIEEGNMPRE